MDSDVLRALLPGFMAGSRALQQRRLRGPGLCECVAGSLHRNQNGRFLAVDEHPWRRGKVPANGPNRVLLTWIKASRS
jgi:hypothetical protein